jgi:hypothetical protein
MTTSQIPATDPVLVAPETWLIPNLAAAGPGRYLPVNSLLVLDELLAATVLGQPAARP